MKHFSILFTLIFALLVFAQSGNAQCSVTLSTYEISLGYMGNAGTEPYGTFIAVTAPAGCNWTATTSADWMSFHASPYIAMRTISGTGNTTIKLTVQQNESDPRIGTIVINDKTITLRQMSGCHYRFQNFPETAYFTADGGNSQYTPYLGGLSGRCTITYTTTDSWIQLGATSYTVQPSAGVARTGTITYHYGNNQTLTLTVNQAASAGCDFTFHFPDGTTQPFNGGSEFISAAGGPLTYRIVGTPAGCSPSYRGSSASWLGNGGVAPNTGPARSGFLMFGGYGEYNGGFNFIVSQASGCTYSLDKYTAEVPASTFNGTYTLTAAAGCTSSPTPDADWITINLNPQLYGSGLIGYTVAANTGAARTGTITAAGQVFTINQAAGKSRKRVRFF